MNKLAALAWLSAIAISALSLFHIKDEVKQLEQSLGEEHRAIRQNQEAIQVLEAEWSYLNQPSRIAELAQKYLTLSPLSTEHVVRLDQLPLREDGTGGKTASGFDTMPASAKLAQ